MRGPVEGAALVFVLTFEDPMRRRLSRCSIELIGHEINDCDQGGEVGCFISRLRLVPGSYTISIGCKVGPAWSDGVKEAVGFRVASGDFYDTGRRPPEGWGYSLVEHYGVTGKKEEG